MYFLFTNKTFRFNNLKTRIALNAKISVIVICVEVMIFLFLYNLHDCTFNIVNIFNDYKIFPHSLYGTKYLKMDQIKLVKDTFLKNLKRGVCFNIVKGCLLQIFLDPLLTTLLFMNMLFTFFLTK